VPRGIPKAKNPDQYQPQSPTSSRELSRKERDLQEWEDSLAKRQELYDNAGDGAEHKLKVLDGRVQAKQEELDALQRKVDAATVALESDITILDNKFAKAKERLADTETSIGTAAESLTVHNNGVNKAKTKLKEVEAEIKVRQNYRDDQERLIDDSINEGNQELNRINREIKAFDTEREELLTKIHQDKLSIGAAKETLEGLQSDSSRLKQRYDEAAASYRAELVDLKRNIEEKRIERDRIVAETDAKLLEIRSERAELEVTREVTQKQKDDVFAEKRRLESMKATYGL
jgi:chromosome segregation ATPase